MDIQNKNHSFLKSALRDSVVSWVVK
jgi:hypothetical protein